MMFSSHFTFTVNRNVHYTASLRQDNHTMNVRQMSRKQVKIRLASEKFYLKE